MLKQTKNNNGEVGKTGLYLFQMGETSFYHGYNTNLNGIFSDGKNKLVVELRIRYIELYEVADKACEHSFVAVLYSVILISELV